MKARSKVSYLIHVSFTTAMVKTTELSALTMPTKYECVIASSLQKFVLSDQSAFLFFKLLLDNDCA